MTQWQEFEQSQNAAIKRSMEKEIYECDKCSCTWFETVEVNQYVSNTLVVPGQKPAPLTPEGYPVLRCMKCGTIKEHQVSVTNPTDKVTKQYYQMLEDIEPDKVEPKEESKDEDKDSGQK
jgi:hypothetical protein